MEKLTLRTLVYSGATTKNSGLNYAEGDQNFITLHKMTLSREEDLGNPAQDHYVLRSDRDGTRSWSSPSTLLPTKLTFNLTVPNSNLQLIGKSFNQLTLQWNATNSATAQSIDNGIGNVPVTANTLSVTGNFVNDINFNLIYTTINREVLTASTSLLFANNIHWGADSENLSSAPLNNLLNKVENFEKIISKTANRTYEFNATGGKYLYFFIPQNLIIEKFKFEQSGIQLTGWEERIVSNYENEEGYSENYVLYRFKFLQHSEIINITI